MSQRLFVQPVVWLSCCAVALVGCSQGPATPTGLAVGLGYSSEAVLDDQPYAGNPVAAFDLKSTGAPDVHGTFSVEDFKGTQNNLGYTHESANGFRAYLQNWFTPNFIYRDGGVGAWAFHDVDGGDNWDRWTYNGVDYGIDGVLACFHSSHGGMSTTGLYSTSLGTDWANRGWDARSDLMTMGGNAGSVLGDERLRYMFWDTCQSVKWSGGINPYTTWGPRASGVRMIFGYDTNTVDSPSYGKFFWEEWNKGKSLTYAFLDASWRISHGQSPCVVAFGDTESEALNRRDNERLMEWPAVLNTWGAWRYYYNAKSAGGGKSRDLAPGEVPSQVAQYHVEVLGSANAQFETLAEAVGIRVADERMIQDRPFGLRAVKTADSTLLMEPDGDFELSFERSGEVKGAAPVADDLDLEESARQIVDQFGLAGDQEYELGSVRYLAESSASAAGDLAETRIVEKTVVFDQVLEGLAFVDPDAGHLELTFDASSAEPLRIRGTIRHVLPDYEKAVTVAPSRNLDELRQIALATFTPPPVPDQHGQAAQLERLEIVPSSEQLGYRMIDGKATPVYRVLLQSPDYPAAKMHEAIVPLAATE